MTDYQSIQAMAQQLTQAMGVAGREDGAAQAAIELLRPLGQPKLSPLGSVLCTINEGQPNAPHLMLEAHLDQIGMMVTRVEEDGFLRVANVGGLDRRLLPASPVTVHTASGDYAAVVASVPPHLVEGEDKPLKMEDILVDTGFTTDHAKELFAPGDSISLDGPLTALGENLLRSRAMDDRIGCVAVLLAAQELHKAAPRAKITVALASMEEVGGVGASTASFASAPDCAIAVDVSFANGFGVAPWKCGQMGDGPMIGVAPVLNNAMTDRLKELAVRDGIPYQIEAMGGRTGTDADGIAGAGAGVATALLSIPLRNMHTVVETIHMDDVANTARLMAAFGKEL